MSTMSLSALSSVSILKAADIGNWRAALKSGVARLSSSADLRRQHDAEQRIAAAIASNGGLLTDDLERRLMPGGRG